jgi:hypothetical protein
MDHSRDKLNLSESLLSLSDFAAVCTINHIVYLVYCLSLMSISFRLQESMQSVRNKLELEHLEHLVADVSKNF